MADVINVSEAVENLVEQATPILMEKAGFLINIFKAIGIVILIYIVYMIIAGILKWKDRRRLKRIEEKVNEVEAKLAKLDKLLGGKHKSSKEDTGVPKSKKSSAPKGVPPKRGKKKKKK